jgi:hypothetical protein
VGSESVAAMKSCKLNLVKRYSRIVIKHLPCWTNEGAFRMPGNELQLETRQGGRTRCGSLF